MSIARLTLKGYHVFHVILKNHVLVAMVTVVTVDVGVIIYCGVLTKRSFFVYFFTLILNIVSHTYMHIIYFQ